VTEILFMDPKEKDIWLPRMFLLCYSNMSRIAPSGLPFETERERFLLELSPALDKAPRRVLLARAGDRLLGYIQYYTRDTLLMIEEVQVDREYHRTRLFYRMCCALVGAIPHGIRTVEAYADRRNHSSLAMMLRLGMETVEDLPASPFLRLSGDAAPLYRRFARASRIP
jgi:hypothetical protein